MDKNKFEKIMMLCKTIEKEGTKGKIYSLGSNNSSLQIPRWDTYIEDLNSILGGGMPKGRIIEISGPESSGKTSLAYHLCGLHDLCLYIPAEGTFETERAKVFGNKPKQMIVFNPEYGEEALDAVLRFTKEGIPLIVIDSIPFLMPKEEYDTVEKDMEKNLRIGGVARLLTKSIPVINKYAEKTGTTIVFINQVRDKMDAMLFGDKTHTPGGHAFKHACSIRIQVARRSWIEIPNKDAGNSANNKKIGLVMKTKIIKSKVCPPYGEALLPMLFEEGFVSVEDAKTIRAEMMKDNRKVKKVAAKNRIDDEDEE